MSHTSNNFFKRRVVLGVDVGTTNIRCYAYDRRAKVIGSAQEKMIVINHEDGRHEIEPDLLWTTFKNVVKDCLSCSELKAEEIACLGISSQRATFLTWDRNTNENFHNFITWKDRRTERLCNKWNSSLTMKIIRFGAHLLYLLTRKKFFQVASVLKFTTSMVLTRLYWILQHNNKYRGMKVNTAPPYEKTNIIFQVQDKILKNEVAYGTMDTWLVWQLTGGKVHATDSSNACVTGFFDPFKMQWMNWLLYMFNIPTHILPVLKDTCDSFGESLPEIFGYSIPINAVVGDQQASMFGAGCLKKYDINGTMGTGSFLNMNTGNTPAASFNGVYPLVGWTISSKPIYIVECCVQDVGTIMSLAQNLGLYSHPNESSKIAQSVSDSGGVFFLPTASLSEIAGEKSLNTSSLIGLKSQTTQGHIVRSILEALSFQIRLLFDAMKGYGIEEAKYFRICGGVAHNDFIPQLIADLIEKPVIRLKHNECSSLGAAFLAGLYCGVWKTLDEIVSIQMECDKFYPNALSTEEYHIRYRTWKKAIYHPIILEKAL